MPEINCLSCAKNKFLGIITYWNYKGDVKCEYCGAIMNIHIESGELQFCILKGSKLVKIDELPLNIQSDVSEAQICQSVGAYKASVVMCRRALEQICDNMSADGNNLKDKIKSLYDDGIISSSLFTAFN